MKYLKVMLVVFLLAFLLVTPVFAQAGDPGDSLPGSALKLPTELIVLVSGVLGYLATQGFKAFGWPLTGTEAKIAASLTTAFVLFAEFLLSMIPAPYQEPAMAVLMLIVTILSAAGIHYSIKSFQKAPPLP